MTGIVADDRCPKCGGPLTTYRDGSRRCKPCRAADRTTQLRRQGRRAAPARFDVAATMARTEPSDADIEAAAIAWRSGQAGKALRALGVSVAQAAQLVGVTRPTTNDWYGGAAPSRRKARAAAALLLACDVIPHSAGPSVPGGPIAYEDLSPVARDCWDDFEAFRARYLGSVSTPWQVMAAQRVVDLLATPHKEHVVINCPQGAGKSRTFTHDLLAWLTVRRRAIRGVIGSNAKTMAEGFTANLRDTLERKAPALARDEDKARGLAHDADATLADDFGWFRTPTSLGGTLWRRDRLVVAQHGGIPSMEKDYTWASFSRETRILGLRCDFMVWDDLINIDMLRNADQVDDLITWWHTEVESRIDTDGLLLLVGQRLRSNDLYRHCLDQRVISDELDDPDSDPDRLKYHHIKVKAHYPELCTGEHPKTMAPTTFDAAGRPTGGGCLSEPLRNGWRDCLERQAAGTYETTFQQEDVDPANVLVRKAWIDGGVDNDMTYEGCWDTDRAVGTLPAHIPPGQTLRYLTVDPSPTKYWAVLDWLYVLPADTERLAGYRYLIDLHRRKMGADQFLDRASDGTYIGLAEDWVKRSKQQGVPITHLIMERNAAQRWAMQYSFFHEWRHSRSVQVIEHETTSNKLDPTYGVWATLPNVYRHGRVRLPGDRSTSSRAHVYQLIAEVTSYPDSTYDDCIMSQWFGEYHLDSLIGAQTPCPPIYNDQPTWIRGGPQPTPAQARIAKLIHAKVPA